MMETTDKATAVNYRQTKPGETRRCLNCTHKQGVPRYWCDKVGRQVNPLATCDEYKEGDQCRLARPA
jgi:hypothetical protein